MGRMIKSKKESGMENWHVLECNWVEKDNGRLQVGQEKQLCGWVLSKASSFAAASDNSFLITMLEKRELCTK